MIQNHFVEITISNTSPPPILWWSEVEESKSLSGDVQSLLTYRVKSLLKFKNTITTFIFVEFAINKFGIYCWWACVCVCVCVVVLQWMCVRGQHHGWQETTDTKDTQALSRQPFAATRWRKGHRL